MSASTLELLPEHVLEQIFLAQSSLFDIAKCKLLSKSLHRFLTTNSAILLHEQCLINHVRIHDTSKQKSSPADLCTRLQSRERNFYNLKPDRKFQFGLSQDEGVHNFYSEGVLIRGSHLTSGRARALTVYDLRYAEEWETLDSTDEEAEGDEIEEEEEEVLQGEDDLSDYQKRECRVDFDINSITADPSQNVLIMAAHSEDRKHVDLHVVDLHTFKPHSDAYHMGGFEEAGIIRKAACSNPTFDMEFPMHVQTRLTICGDKVFVFLSHEYDVPIGNGGGQEKYGEIVVWDWKTGQKILWHPSKLFPYPSEQGSLQLVLAHNFVLLGPNVYGVVEYHIVVRLDTSITPSPCRLTIYTVVPKKELNGDGLREPTCVGLLMGLFELPILDDMVGIQIQAYPPPTAFYPMHPPKEPLEFTPDPETGMIVLTFDSGDTFGPRRNPSYSYPVHDMFLYKETLRNFLPATKLNTEEMLQLVLSPSYKYPKIPLADLAPNCRILEKRFVQQWGHNQYHYRFLIAAVKFYRSGHTAINIRMHDFNPHHSHKLIAERTEKWYQGKETTWEHWNPDIEIARRQAPDYGIVKPRHLVLQSNEVLEGTDRKGRRLITSEMRGNLWSDDDIITGKSMPYIICESDEATQYEHLILDGSRIIGIEDLLDPPEDVDPQPCKATVMCMTPRE